MLLSEFIASGIRALEKIYPTPEARSIVLRLCSDRLGTESWSHIVNPGLEIPVGSLGGLRSDMDRLLRSEPIQYVLGHETFCDRVFRVGEGVLIPRPETEQLAGIVISRLGGDGAGRRIIDLCTGSGCIAWTLFKELPGCCVTGVDISEKALSYARLQFPGPSPEFIRADILEPEGIPVQGKFDVVVSNPPYVTDSEKSGMRRNVVGYEPAQALFVSDNDPLVFYRSIAVLAAELLVDGGFGAVEINERFPEETAALFRNSGFTDVNTIRDFLGKPRIVTFRFRIRA